MWNDIIDPREVIVDGKVDWTKFPLPQVYHYPNESIGGVPLHSLKLSMPPEDGFARTFKRPTIHPDGSIEYQPSELHSTAKPDDIDGYTRDPENPYRFIPKWQPCVYRLQGLKLKPNGSVDVKMACSHPEASTYGNPVLCRDCNACPLRTETKLVEIKHGVRQSMEARDFQQPHKNEDGTLVYPRTGFEPPVCPEGYHRSPNDPWTFIPEWQSCVHRTFENTVRPCGCVNINAVCHSPESGHQNQRVGFTTCQGCPVRKPEPETFTIK